MGIDYVEFIAFNAGSLIFVGSGLYAFVLWRKQGRISGGWIIGALVGVAIMVYIATLPGPLL